jgi:glycosyltransferase involved in cell wall biosynthesis
MNILLLSNSPGRGYGYSVVADQVALGLKKAGHEVFFAGMQNVNSPFKDKEGIVILGLRYDAWMNDILPDYLRIYHINCLITILDIWLDQTMYIGPLVKQMNIPWVAHVTCNSYPLSVFLTRNCSQANLLVAPSKFVEKTLKEVFPQNTFYIPHGVDTSIFKPLPEEEKKKMKEKLRIEDKSFVLLTVMRNKSPYQKDYPTLFRAWKALLETHEELKKEGILLCLTDYLEPTGLRIDILRERAGLKDNVRFIWFKPTEDFSSIEATFEGDPRGALHTANLNFPHEEMAKIYNIADAYVQSSFGESFGLPILESMSCGIPQINAEQTTGIELVSEPKTGLCAKIKAELTTPLISDQWLIDAQSLAECMEKIYLSDKLRKEFSKNALKFSKNFDWSKIIPKWQTLVESVEYLS